MTAGAVPVPDPGAAKRWFRAQPARRNGTIAVSAKAGAHSKNKIKSKHYSHFFPA